MNTNSDIRVAMERQAERADARSRIYSLLAQALRYPEAAVFEAIRDGAYGETLRDAIGQAFPSFAAEFGQRFLPQLVASGEMAGFEASHLAAFENNLPKPSLSLYEGSYGERRGNKAGLLLELKAFYRNFGLSMADKDMEDALVAELEFMQFLAAKQALAERGMLDRKPYLLAQRDFLERHLAGWLPQLEAEATAVLDHPFWRAVVSLVAALVAADLDAVRGDVAGMET